MAEAKSSDRLDKMEQEIAELQQAIWRGNGQPGIVTQIAEMRREGRVLWAVALLIVPLITTVGLFILDKYLK